MKEKGKKNYFLFLQNEFQGSSALDVVGVHGLTASDKYRLSAEKEDNQPRSFVIWTYTDRERGGEN